MKVVLVTGGFDPLHSGHIAYIKTARKLGDYLIVGLNSDEWLARKKGRAFMPWVERAAILSELKDVGRVIDFDDSDNTAKDAIRKVRRIFSDTKLIFANGGDRTKNNIPEMDINDTNIEFVFGVGGENKANSSSWILDEWKTQKTERPWGYWRVLDDKKTVKVKELVIDPGCSLSDQRHFKRSEHWYILQGTCDIDTEYKNVKQTITLEQHRTYIIGCEVWHRAFNNTSAPCHVLEVQYGGECTEEDIERRDQ